MSKEFEDLKLSEEEVFKNNLKLMLTADLHALFIFVSGDFNKQFGGRTETRQLIHARYEMILDELNGRAYGCDPYKLHVVKFDGDTPENIDLSKFEKGNE